LDAASDGDTILIADGTFSGEGNTGIQWDATNRHLVIKLEKGWEHCIIDCMEEDRGFVLNHGQDHRDVIDGLTITGGSVLGAGGAIYISSASPVIKNCLLINNSALGYHDNSYSGCGGAIMVLNECDPLILGNIIRDNIADNLGGGLLFAEFASGELANNVIETNRALDHYGGGIALWNNASPGIINNLVFINSSGGVNGGRGGGIYLDNSNAKLTNNTIVFNYTNGDTYGDGSGGGIFIGDWASPVIENSIIWYNRSGASSRNIYFDPMEWLDISYCNVEVDLGHIFELEPHTNMDAPPAFTDTLNGNFQLKWGSPCINMGDTDTSGLNLPSMDLAGNQRIYEGRIDIGAYEFNQPLSSSTVNRTEEFQVYPNPAKGFFFVVYRGMEEFEDPLLRICDLKGLVVREFKLDLKQDPIAFDCDERHKGIYILTVMSRGKALYRQKLFID
jgi:hypothetical protein